MSDLPGIQFREKMKSRLDDVGENQLNVEHEQLLNLILDADEILALMLQRELAVREWETLGDIMNELMNYTRRHFSFEEEVMHQHGYPKVNEHIKQHAYLVEKLNAFQQQVIGHDSDVKSEIRQWLLEWLFVHINTYDLQYKPYLEKA